MSLTRQQLFAVEKATAFFPAHSNSKFAIRLVRTVLSQKLTHANAILKIDTQETTNDSGPLTLAPPEP